MVFGPEQSNKLSVLVKLFQCTVVIELFDMYNDNISQHITINLIVTIRPCLASVTLSEKKADM